MLTLCAVFLLQASICEAVTISFSPVSPLVLTYNETQSGTGRPLTITCSQPGNDTLLSMSLYKNTATGLSTRLIFATLGIDPGTGGLPKIDTATGAAVSGSLTQRAITLIYTQASCDHNGTYKCFSSVYSSGDVQQFESVYNYTVTVIPGQAEITVTSVTGPSGQFWYLVGHVVNYTCTVNVGTFTSTTFQEIQFFWRYEVDVGFGMKVFQDYPNLQDIDNSRPGVPSVGQTCQTLTKTSVLTRYLTIDDAKRPYKCYVRKGSYTYEALAAFVVVIDVRDRDSVPDSHQPNADSVPDSHQPNAAGQLERYSSPFLGGVIGGSFAGGTIFGILLVLGVILLLQCYRSRISTPAVNVNSSMQLRQATDRIVPSAPGIYDGLQTRELGSRNPYEQLKIPNSTAQPFGYK